MAKKYVIGIDVGTSGSKCIALAQDGEILASVTREYPLYQPREGWTEQDPDDWWNAVCESLKIIVEKVGDNKPEGISFSGQMHGMVALDENNRPVRRALLWNDQRTQKQCDEITEMAGGLEKLLTYTNNQMITGYTGSKIMWLKEEEPDLYEKVKVVVNPKDYIRYKLTGLLVTEVSDASGFGLFNVKERTWSYELIEKIGLKKEIFPECVESTDPTGVVTAEAEAICGVAAGSKVYGGGGDAVISTTGMGLVQPGKVGITLGTSGVVAMGLPAYSDNEGGKLQVFCNNKPGTWHAMGVTLAAAGSYQWFRNAIGTHEKALQEETGEDAYELLNRQAEQTPAGADGLIYLPYLTGERCPLYDPKAKGAFIGITSMHNKGHFARAVMEGVAFSLKQVYDLIASLNPDMETNEIIISGGGARGQLWRHILADIFQLPVHTVNGSAEGGAFGAALVAGTGCGLWETMEDAMKLAYPDSEVLPNPENESVYKAQYGKYVRLYDALKEFE